MDDKICWKIMQQKVTFKHKIKRRSTTIRRELDNNTKPCLHTNKRTSKIKNIINIQELSSPRRGVQKVAKRSSVWRQNTNVTINYPRSDKQEAVQSRILSGNTVIHDNGKGRCMSRGERTVTLQSSLVRLKYRKFAMIIIICGCKKRVRLDFHEIIRLRVKEMETKTCHGSNFTAMSRQQQ